MTLYTIGHSYCGRDNLTERLRTHDIETLIDVRSFPGSRRNPDVHKEAMQIWLPQRGIGYRHEPRLGGRRKPPKQRIPEDGWWRVESFANYAAHTRTPEWQNAYRELMIEARDHNIVMMCGEPVPFRCHRRMIADVATFDGVDVYDIWPDGSSRLHKSSGWLEQDVPCAKVAH